MTDFYSQTTAETLDYVIDLGRFLEPAEMVDSAVAGSSLFDPPPASADIGGTPPAPVLMNLVSVISAPRAVTLRLSGGAGANTKYAVTTHILTTNGREKSVTFGVVSQSDPLANAPLPTVSILGGITEGNASANQDI